MTTTRAMAGTAKQKPAPAPWQRPIPPDGWQEVYLRKLRSSGGFYLASEAAGVSHDTAERYRHANPDFEARVHEAYELWADDLQTELRDGAQTKANPVPHIVLLKKARPAEYIERSVSLSVGMQGEIGAEDGLSLVKALLGLATPATLAAVPHDTAQPTAQPAQVCDSQGPNPVTLPAENRDTP